MQLPHRLGGAIGAIAELGDGEELRLPGLPAHPLAPHRLDRGLDRVRPDRLHPVRQVEPGKLHLQADDRRDQEVGLIYVAELGVEQREGAIEAGAVERELGAAVPEGGEEGHQHPRGPLAGVDRDRSTLPLEVVSGDVGDRDRVEGLLEPGEGAQLVLALEHVFGGQRAVAVEGRLRAGLLVDVERDLVTAGDQSRIAGRGFGGELLDRLVEDRVAHSPRFPSPVTGPAAARPLAETVAVEA